MLVYSSSCILAILLFGNAESVSYLFLPLLLILLPTLNAPIDWLSLSITRWLLQKMQQHHHNGFLLITYGLFDLLLAVGFVFLLSAILLLVIIAMNHLCVGLSGQLLIDFNVLMPGIARNPADYTWLHLMVVSTLIPTLLHFTLVLYSVVSWPIAHWGKPSYRRLHQHESEKHGCFRKDRLTIMYASHFRLLATGLLLAGIVWLLTYLHGGIDAIARSFWHWADFILALDPEYQSANPPFQQTGE